MPNNQQRRYDRDRWPHFWLQVPQNVELECPRCKAKVECEVITSDDGMAHAEIDTDFCEGCGTLFCPKCPRKKIYDLDWCEECAPTQEAA